MVQRAAIRRERVQHGQDNHDIPCPAVTETEEPPEVRAALGVLALAYLCPLAYYAVTLRGPSSLCL